MTDLTKKETEQKPAAKVKRNGSASKIPFLQLVRPRVGVKRFAQDLIREILRDDVTNSAAVLAYYSMLSIFPATILLLSLLPYLPIPNLDATIIEAMYRGMPTQAADLLASTVTRVVSQPRSGLLSFGLLGTLWAASSGLQAMMQELHSTYEEKETRPYWKRRLLAILMVFAVGFLVIGAFGLVIIGGLLENRLSLAIGENHWILGLFMVSRWITIYFMMLAAMSLLYYFGPNVRQTYRFITPGGLVSTTLFIVASVLFRIYVENFGSYEATYGSLGAAIVLLLWLYVGGFVILVGAEINGLLERYAHAHQDRASRKTQ